jgi:ABC-type nitrate/sulfonate/bicarbonate transport system substrate-binding protein
MRMCRRSVQLIVAILTAAVSLVPLALHAGSTNKVRLAFSVLAYANPPFWITHELKLLEKYGLETELVYISGSRPIQAMLGGSVDVLPVGSAAGLSPVLAPAWAGTR